MLSDGGIRLAQLFLPVRLTDPMSGFFMLPRPLFETLAANLTGQGFKILLDLALSSPAPLRVIEIPFVFHERVAGESKLDALVLAQFAGLLLDKVFGGLLPLRFISFALVGALGVLVHLAVLTVGAEARRAAVRSRTGHRHGRCDGVQLPAQQRDHLSRPAAPRAAACGAGCCCSCWSAASVRSPISASPIRCMRPTPTGAIAGAIGAVIGVVWNYAVSATLVWRAR